MARRVFKTLGQDGLRFDEQRTSLTEFFTVTLVLSIEVGRRESFCWYNLIKNPGNSCYVSGNPLKFCFFRFSAPLPHPPTKRGRFAFHIFPSLSPFSWDFSFHALPHSLVCNPRGGFPRPRKRRRYRAGTRVVGRTSVDWRRKRSDGETPDARGRARPPAFGTVHPGAFPGVRTAPSAAVTGRRRPPPPAVNEPRGRPVLHCPPPPPSSFCPPTLHRRPSRRVCRDGLETEGVRTAAAIGVFRCTLQAASSPLF